MMKDLDFDELDQAVNSLMTGIPKGPAPDDEAAKEKMLTIKPTLSDNERPSFATLEQTAAKAGTELDSLASRADPLAARRSSGRFMDVVHPSSDMKINNRPVVSREGLQLNPIAARPVVSTPRTIEPAVTDVAIDQSPVVVETEPVQANDWPDPIDMQTEPEESVVSEEPVAEDTMTVSAPAPVDPVPVAPVVEEQAPLQTPFLMDTKVEKRPLGAFATDLHDVAGVASTDEVSTQNLDDQLVADPVKTLDDTPTELPDELQHSLVRIESDNEAPKEPVEETVAPSFSSPVVTPAPVVSNGPVSIQPQYKEEQSTVPAEHAAIYDTDSYHKPLAHPGKKKSGWLWVLWIVLLLAAGAGGAAALYYFKII